MTQDPETPPAASSAGYLARDDEWVAPTDRAPEPRVQEPAGRREGLVRARGSAHSIQLRFDQPRSQDVLSFRLDRYDAAGNRLDPVPVELRGRGLAGQVSEGEEVEVTGEWSHGTVRGRDVVNLTTRAQVRVWRWQEHRTALIAVALALALVAVGVGILVTRSGSSSAPHVVPEIVGTPRGFAEVSLLQAGFDRDRLRFIPGGVGGIGRSCTVVDVSPPTGSSVADDAVVRVRFLEPASGLPPCAPG